MPAPLPINTAWLAQYIARHETPVVNSIVFLWQNPCAIRPSAYVELAFPALGTALVTFFTFGWEDVVRGALRPKGSLCGRIKQKKPRARPGFLRQLLTDDIGNNIGKHLPGTNTIRSIKYSKGYTLAWVVDNLSQRGLFYWLLLGISEDIFINWTTGIIDAHCTPGLFDWEGSCYDPQGFFIPLVPIQDVTMVTDGDHVNCGATGGVISIPFARSGFIYGSLDATNTGPNGAAFELVMWTDQGGGQEFDSSNSQFCIPGEIGHASVGAFVQGAGSFYLRMRPNGTNWHAVEGFIVGSGKNI